MDRLALMEAFVRVVESGSFSAAARHLGIGQPSVSKAINQLEQRLGVKLLLRTTPGFAATESGQSLYERTKLVIENVEEAEIAARGVGIGLRGRLRVSSFVTLGPASI